MKFLKMSLLLLSICNTGAFAADDTAPKPLAGVTLNDLRLIPTQSGGRVMPFDEFARETVLSINGARSYKNFDPSEMMISMMVFPQLWAREPIIRISNPDVSKQLLLDPARKYFAPDELATNNAFLQYAQGLLSEGKDAEQVTDTGVNAVMGHKDARTEELKRVVDRVSRFQALVTGKIWNVTPPKDGNPESAWSPLSTGMNEASSQSQMIYGLLKSYLDKDVAAFNRSAALARTVTEEATPEFESLKPKLLAETFYNRLRPFLQAMIFYILAGLLWFFAKSNRMARLMAKFLTFAAVMMHVIGFGLRCYVAGRPPVTNMYESIIWVSLGVMAFALIIYAKNRHTVLISTSTFLAGLSLFAADSAPLFMDPTIRPLVAVLRSNYWLTIHVLTITLSYGAFMLAMGISNVALFHFLKRSKVGPTVESSQRIALLNQISYRALMFGTVLIAAGTILGGIWADESWGRP